MALPEGSGGTGPAPRVLVTIPVHNEQGFLRPSVLRLNARLRERGLDFRIAIAEDGSDDGTGAEIERLQREIPGLIVQRIPQRVGRGAALRNLWSQLDAEVYLFVDADLPTDPDAVVDLVRAIDAGADVATGSRYCAHAEVRRPPVRNAASLVYNGLVRFLFQEPLKDHQCGLKALRRSAAALLIPLSHEDSWAWDTEILVLAHRIGLRVEEVPVDWTERRYRRTPMRRLVADILLHGGFVWRLRSELAERLQVAGVARRRSLALPSASDLEEPTRIRSPIEPQLPSGQ